MLPAVRRPCIVTFDRSTSRLPTINLGSVWPCSSLLPLRLFSNLQPNSTQSLLNLSADDEWSMSDWKTLTVCKALATDLHIWSSDTAETFSWSAKPSLSQESIKIQHCHLHCHPCKQSWCPVIEPHVLQIPRFGRGKKTRGLPEKNLCFLKIPPRPRCNS